MKRIIISICLLFCVTFFAQPIIASAETAGNQASNAVVQSSSTGQWEYTTYGEGVALTGYLGSSSDVSVPNALEIEGNE